MSTPLADMVERLLSAGIPPEAVVAAVRAAELHAQGLVGADPVATRRRAYDRERKRRKAAENSIRATPAKERSPAPPKEKLLPEERQDLFSRSEEDSDTGVTRARARASRLPDDWAPSRDDLAFAATLLGEAQVVFEVARFSDHWRAAHGPPAVKRDWSAAWRNWCRKAVEINGTHNGSHRRDHGQGGWRGREHRGFAARSRGLGA